MESSEKVKILVIDDELSMRQFLQILLKKDGYDVTTAENGEIALRKLKEEKFTVILMDYNMPEAIDGIDLLNELLHTSPKSQVIVITAYASTEQAIKAIELGAVDYVSKPFNVAEIRDIVKKCVAPAQTQSIYDNSPPTILASLSRFQPVLKYLPFLLYIDGVSSSDDEISALMIATIKFIKLYPSANMDQFLEYISNENIFVANNSNIGNDSRVDSLPQFKILAEKDENEYIFGASQNYQNLAHFSFLKIWIKH